MDIQFNYYWPFKVLEYRIQITRDKLVKAIAGDNNDEIDLLDERGCPTDPVIFPGLTQLPNSRDLQGNFEAFKFSDTSVVRLDSYLKYSKIMWFIHLSKNKSSFLTITKWLFHD